MTSLFKIFHCHISIAVYEKYLFPVSLEVTLHNSLNATTNCDNLWDTREERLATVPQIFKGYIRDLVSPSFFN